jgi:hypothetical protein
MPPSKRSSKTLGMPYPWVQTPRIRRGAKEVINRGRLTNPWQNRSHANPTAMSGLARLWRPYECRPFGLVRGRRSDQQRRADSANQD